MKKTLTIILAVTLALAMLGAFAAASAEAAVADGLYLIDGTWQLWIGGAHATGYTALWNDPNLGWWLVADGNVAGWYNGLWEDPNVGWWLIQGGTPQFGYTGVFNDANLGPWNIVNGQPTTQASQTDVIADGLHEVNGVWCLYLNGQMASGYTGLYNDGATWWLIENGTITFSYTGLFCDPQYGWWMIGSSQVWWDFNGIWNDPVYGWWKIKNGTIDWGFRGLVEDPIYGWWLIYDGTVAFNYTGNWDDPQYGTWYINGGALGGKAITKTDGVIFSDQFNCWVLMKNGQIDWNYTGLYEDSELGWWLIGGGQVQFSWSKLYNDPTLGLVLVQNGQPMWNYTGFWKVNDFEWFIRNGKHDKTFKGLFYDTEKQQWRFVSNGGFDRYYWAVAKDTDGNLWLVKDGTIDTSYSGLWNDTEEYGWVNVINGKVETEGTQSGVVYYNEHGAFYMKNGEVVEKYTGTAIDENGKWVYMLNGGIDDTFTALIKIDPGFAYYRNGTPDLSFTGIAWNPQGAYYVKNGYVDFTYSGTYKDGGITYEVKEGIAKAVSSDTPMLGVFFKSREDTSDMLYVSFDGVNFYYLGDAFTDKYPNDAGSDVATIDKEGKEQVPVSTLRDPSIFYKDGVFWMVGDTVKADTGEFVPLLAYSTDLVNWSYPGGGKYLAETNSGLIPKEVPLDANGNRTPRTDYHSLASDAFVDDDGTVWMVVTLGHYADSQNNQLSQYLLKITDLKAPADSSGLTDAAGRLKNSFFSVNYGDLVPIHLPYTTDYLDREKFEYNGNTFDYDGMLFKNGGKYYLAVQHDGQEITLWTIDDLNKASDANAWKMVTEELAAGYEGPSVVYNNGKFYLYSDRLDGWEHRDDWEDEHGEFVLTSDTLTETFRDKAKVNAVDETGKTYTVRHGSVITLTDEKAKQTVQNLYAKRYAK